MAKKDKKNKWKEAYRTSIPPLYHGDYEDYGDRHPPPLDYKPVKPVLEPIKKTNGVGWLVVGLGALIILILGITYLEVGPYPIRPPNPPVHVVIPPNPPVTPTPPEPTPPVTHNPDYNGPGYNSHGKVVQQPDPDESGHHLRWLHQRNPDGSKKYFWRDENGQRHWWPQER